MSADAASRDVEAAIFDLGSVLIEWDPAPAYRRAFSGQDTAVEDFLDNFLRLATQASCRVNAPLCDIVAPLIRSHPQHQAFFEFFAEQWHQFVIDPMRDTVALLEELDAAGVRLYALTNWPAHTYPPTTPGFGFLRLFDDVIVSGAISMWKPQREIFAEAIRRFDVQPARTCFIDDREENVLAASELGFHSHQFVSARSLAEFLSQTVTQLRR